MQSMLDFLVNLMRDAEAREAFMDNPERVLTTAGFTTECGEDWADMTPFLADNPCVSGGGDSGGGDAITTIKKIVNNYNYNAGGHGGGNGHNSADIDGNGNQVAQGEDNAVSDITGDDNQVIQIPGDDNVVQTGNDNIGVSGNDNVVQEGLINIEGGVANSVLGEGLLNDVLERADVLESVVSSRDGDILDEVLSPAGDLVDVDDVLENATELVDVDALTGGLLGGVL
jgi:urease gamma subunit